MPGDPSPLTRLALAKRSASARAAVFSDWNAATFAAAVAPPLAPIMESAAATTTKGTPC